MVISNACPIQFWPVSEDTFNEKEVDGITPTCFCQPVNSADEITVQFTSLGDSYSAYTLSILDSNGNEIYSEEFTEVVNDVWQLTIIPQSNSPELSGKVQFKILADSVEVYKSDCIDIKGSHSNSLLINYSNGNNYAGLIYTETSPDTTFQLRIFGVFFHEEPVTVQEDLELSDDTIHVLYDKLNMKRALEVGFMPYYMHQKLLLALNHQFVSIDGKDWIRRDEYSIDKGNKHYPLKKALVLLTDQDYVKRNLL